MRDSWLSIISPDLDQSRKGRVEIRLLSEILKMLFVFQVLPFSIFVNGTDSPGWRQNVLTALCACNVVSNTATQWWVETPPCAWEQIWVEHDSGKRYPSLSSLLFPTSPQETAVRWSARMLSHRTSGFKATSLRVSSGSFNRLGRLRSVNENTDIACHYQ